MSSLIKMEEIAYAYHLAIGLNSKVASITLASSQRLIKACLQASKRLRNGRITSTRQLDFQVIVESAQDRQILSFHTSQNNSFPFEHVYTSFYAGLIPG